MSQRHTAEEILDALRAPLMKQLARYPEYGSLGFDVTFHQGEPVQTEWRIREKSALPLPASPMVNRVSLDTKKVTIVRRRARTIGD